MATFVIQPHSRLHERAADELGYSRDEGLQYDLLSPQDQATAGYEAAVLA